MQDLDKLKACSLICAEFVVKKKTSVNNFYKENNFKPCLTKQLLNMFKLWCERGMGLVVQKPVKVPLTLEIYGNLPKENKFKG